MAFAAAGGSGLQHYAADYRAFAADLDFSEARGTAHALALHEHLENFALLGLKMDAQAFRCFSAQARSALFHKRTVELGHACRRCLWPRREGKDMHKAQPALVREPQRVCKHGFVLCREASNQVCSEYHIRAQFPYGLTKLNYILTRVPAFHALQDQVVARLKREVKVGHEALFFG